MVDALEQPKRAKRRPLSIWELPQQLLTSVHRFRSRIPRKGRERKHYAAILAFCYRNRFCTASQVQRRFHQFLKSDRTARRHLAEMHESLGYFDLVPTPSPLWPKVYSVSRRGLQKLRRSLAKQGKGAESFAATSERRRVYSISHVIHEIFVTEFLSSLAAEARDSSVFELLMVQRRSLVKHPGFQISGRPRGWLIPDALFLIRHRTHGMICTFLEVETGSNNRRYLEGKFHRYGRWWDSESGKQYLQNLYVKYGAVNPRPAFRIAVVCGGRLGVNAQRCAESLFNLASDGETKITKRLWITTVSDLVTGGNGDKPLQSEIWRRAGNAGLSSFVAK